MKIKIKQIFNIIICLLIVFTLYGCKKNNNDNDGNRKINELYIYSINDFHGNLESTDNEKGIARIAGYIKSQIEDKNAPSLILSAGDMFQGTGISNYTKGQSVVEIMNEIGFNAMTLGNHEFDWGIETVLAYQDGDETNGEADFPFLGCNVVLKDTNTIIPSVDPYTIIEQDGLKIGIIGYMGYGLEEDIATAMIEPYEFLDPTSCVETYARKLRGENDCDIVIAVGHDGETITNRKLSKLTGDARIDAIINGHTHASYIEEYRREDGVTIPCIQSGTAGNYVGVIKLSINEETKEVTGGTAYNKQMNSKVAEDETIKMMVNQIVEDTAPIFKRVLCTAGETINQLRGCYWAASALQEAMDVDVAIINTGGIRNSAFPINSGDQVDVAKVYEIMPFDNTIKTVTLKGSQIRVLFGSGELCYSSNVTGNNSSGYYINGILLDDEAYYRVAAVDYIFDQSKYPFQSGTNIVATGILFRDILINDLEQIGQSGSKWVG